MTAGKARVRVTAVEVPEGFYVGDLFFQLGNWYGTLDRFAVLPVSTVTLHGHEFPAPRDPRRYSRS